MRMRRFQLLMGLAVLLLTGATTDQIYAQSLQFINVQRLTNKEVALTFTAPAGRSYRLESSTNAMDWSALVTFATNVTTSLQHTDSASWKYRLDLSKQRGG